jgi:hypothetical protein
MIDPNEGDSGRVIGVPGPASQPNDAIRKLDAL